MKALMNGKHQKGEEPPASRWMRPGFLFSGVFMLGLIILVQMVESGNREIFLQETFDNLKQWEAFIFEDIEKHTQYTPVPQDGDPCLKAESDQSASALIFKGRFDTHEFPRMHWRWKIENVYRNGDATLKSGDDYPLRIYVIFAYNPEEAGLWEKLKYGSVKLMYGKYPPHSSLSYIWANKTHPARILTNVYTDQSKMIVLQEGVEHVGKWIDEDVNMLEDYQEAFGEDPPAVASVAIMNDSDNTGEKSVSYLDDLIVYSD